MTRIQELIGELVALWAAQGAPIASHLLPGATAEDLDRAEQELGFPLSGEVRDWYASHNGYVNPSSPRQAAQWPNGAHAGSLEEAVENHHAERARAARAADRYQGLITLPFGPAWITLVRPSKNMLVADCAAAASDRQAPSSLHYMHADVPEDWPTVVLPSLTSLLEAWLTLTRTRAIRYDSDLEDWNSDRASIPPELDLPEVVYL
jgi:hypothetical protein